ncbi:MAG: hypothetical protein AAF730_05930 [Bacteroidota bacterium]
MNEETTLFAGNPPYAQYVYTWGNWDELPASGDVPEGEGYRIRVIEEDSPGNAPTCAQAEGPITALTGDSEAFYLHHRYSVDVLEPDASTFNFAEWTKPLVPGTNSYTVMWEMINESSSTAGHTASHDYAITFEVDNEAPIPLTIDGTVTSVACPLGSGQCYQATISDLSALTASIGSLRVRAIGVPGYEPGVYTTADAFGIAYPLRIIEEEVFELSIDTPAAWYMGVLQWVQWSTTHPGDTYTIDVLNTSGSVVKTLADGMICGETGPDLQCRTVTQYRPTTDDGFVEGHQYRLRVTHEDGATAQTSLFTLQARPVGPILAFLERYETAYDFGEVALGYDRLYRFSIWNAAEVPSGADPADYELDITFLLEPTDADREPLLNDEGQPVTAAETGYTIVSGFDWEALTEHDVTLPAGQQRLFAVRFTAKRPDEQFARLTITHNDLFSGLNATGFTIDFDATGTTARDGTHLAFGPQVDRWGFGPVAEGYTETRTLFLENKHPEDPLDVAVELESEFDQRWGVAVGSALPSVQDGSLHRWRWSGTLVPAQQQQLGVSFTAPAYTCPPGAAVDDLCRFTQATAVNLYHYDQDHPDVIPVSDAAKCPDATKLPCYWSVIQLRGEVEEALDDIHLAVEPAVRLLSFHAIDVGETAPEFIERTILLTNRSTVIPAGQTTPPAITVQLGLSDRTDFALSVENAVGQPEEVCYFPFDSNDPPCTGDYTILPGESLEVTVHFLAQNAGLKLVDLAIFHSDADLGTGPLVMNVEGVARSGASKRYYYMADHLGSVRATVNEDGVVVGASDYYPFGLEQPGRVYQAGNGTAENYTGHELDTESNSSMNAKSCRAPTSLAMIWAWMSPITSSGVRTFRSIIL